MAEQQSQPLLRAEASEQPHLSMLGVPAHFTEESHLLAQGLPTSPHKEAFPRSCFYMCVVMERSVGLC